MHWRTTAFLACALAALFGIWAGWRPAPGEVRRATPLFTSRNDEVTRIEIQPLGRPEVILERRRVPEGSLSWTIIKPIERPAWEPHVLEMLSALRQLTAFNAIGPGQAGYDPEAAGTLKPEMVVHVIVGSQRKTLKFGRLLAKDPSQRWFTLEGDPNQYFAEDRHSEPFRKSVAELRHRGLLFFEPHRVVRMEVASRYERAKAGPDGTPVKGADGKPLVEAAFETSMFESVENASGLRGWYWTKRDDETVEERLDEVAVHRLIGEVTSLLADDFRPVEYRTPFGLDPPATRFRFWLKDQITPYVLSLGRSEESGGRKVTYAEVGDSGELAVIEDARLHATPRTRNQFRSRQVYDFGRDEVFWFQIENDLGRVRLVCERASDPAGPAEKWTVTDPPGLELDKEELEVFLNGLFTLKVDEENGFVGRQPDLKLFGLDPPGITLTFQLRRKSGVEETQVFRFGLRGDAAFLGRPRTDEIFGIAEFAYRKLDRVDLNFRSPVLFNVPRKSIVEIWADIADEADPGKRHYFWIERQGGDSWIFRDAVNKGEVDPVRLGDVLTVVNFIRADEFLSRRPEVAREYGLDANNPPGKLVIKYSDGVTRRERTLRISRAHRPEGGGDPIRYGLFRDDPQDDPIVFRLEPKLLETILRGVLREGAAPK